VARERHGKSGTISNATSQEPVLEVLAGEMSGVQAEGLLVPPTRIERATNGLGILPSQTEPTQQEPTEAKNQESEKD